MSFRKPLITILCSFIIPGVYYNTFYNAEKAFDDAVKLIEQASLVEQDTVSPQAKKLLGKAIDNSNIVIIGLL